MVRLEFCVQADWTIVLRSGVVEVVIEGGEINLFLYSILICHSQEILSVHCQEQIDRSLSQLLVVKQKAANIKTADLLQDQHYGIVLQFKGIQNAINFI